MPEQELKLHVPQDSRPGLEKALLRGAVKKVSLNALYFDTPSRDLVRAKIALRLRLEGDQWVQTLKMPGGSFAILPNITPRNWFPIFFKHLVIFPAEKQEK